MTKKFGLIATLWLAFLPVQAFGETPSVCLKAKTIVEGTKTETMDRLKAWQTWRPQCADSGFYELTLAEYLIKNGQQDKARQHLEHALTLGTSYQDQIEALLKSLQ